MRFSVVGASGFIGGKLARHLRSRSMECFLPTREDPRLFSQPLGHVLYCAGFTGDFLAKPADTIEAHVSLLSRLLSDADFASLVYLSSTRLYDSGDAVGCEEDDLVLNPNVPRHFFDLSKALGESLCVTAARPGVCAVRLSSVYSDDLGSDNFLHEVVAAARAGQSRVFDVAPDTARDYIHVDEVCELLVAVARRGRRPIYNLASGVNVSNEELFEAVHRLTGCRMEASRGPSEIVAPVIDVAAIRDDFGARPVPLHGHLPRMLGLSAWSGAA